jgi:hypothetical protein
MALDIYFRDDIANALMAADEASASTAAALHNVTSDPQYLRAYRQGYRAALATVACAFGLGQASSNLRRVPDETLEAVGFGQLELEASAW